MNWVTSLFLVSVSILCKNYLKLDSRLEVLAAYISTINILNQLLQQYFAVNKLSLHKFYNTWYSTKDLFALACWCSALNVLFIYDWWQFQFSSFDFGHHQKCRGIGQTTHNFFWYLLLFSLHQTQWKIIHTNSGIILVLHSVISTLLCCLNMQWEFLFPILFYPIVECTMLITWSISDLF